MFRPVEVYTQWKWLYYEDGSGTWRDSCVVLQKPRLTDRERRRFHERAGMQKRVLAEGAGGMDPRRSVVAVRTGGSRPSAFPEMASRDMFPASSGNGKKMRGADRFTSGED